jgi:hypothetical protein
MRVWRLKGLMNNSREEDVESDRSGFEIYLFLLAM